MDYLFPSIVDYGIYRPKKDFNEGNFSRSKILTGSGIHAFLCEESFTESSPRKPVSNFLKIFRCCDRTEITEPAIRSERKPALNYEISLTNRVFSPSIYGPNAKRAGHKSKGKKRGSVTYSTDRENEFCKIFIISLLCLTGSGTIFIHAERLQISDAPRKQNESI